jgi:hypothetical protein
LPLLARAIIELAAALIRPGQSLDLRGGRVHGGIDEILLGLGRGDMRPSS